MKSSGEVRCSDCDQTYPVVDGVPDLRIQSMCDFDLEEDRAQVLEFMSGEADSDAASLVRKVFSSRPEWSEELVEFRTAVVVGAPGRLVPELEGWLSEVTRGAGPFLDIGCGPGMLLAAASTRGCQGIGIDLSLQWLVVARRLVAEYGGTPILAAGLGEALPLRDQSVTGIAGLDVIEHVMDAPRVMRELDRVIRPGAEVVLTTPNRFSLTPEPHVFVWGVGWLPRPLQARYVRWRSNKPYDHTNLYSSRELTLLFREHTELESRIVIPLVPDEGRKSSRLRDLLVAVYNRVAGWKVVRPFFLMCGPFFRIHGRKPVASDGG